MNAVSLDDVGWLAFEAPEEVRNAAFTPVLVPAIGRVDPAVLIKRTQRHDWVVYDTIETQLEELLRSRAPAQDAVARHDAMVRCLNGRSPTLYGTWVFFPWSRSVVHVLPCDEYRELRLSRNRNKITSDEQVRLLNRRIGIIGLSVGYCIAQTLVLEGVGGVFHLADPDTLCLSNLNRVPAGNHSLGVNKAVAAARRLFEIDPYLSVRVYSEGLTAENVTPFLVGDGTLDLVIEECDDLATKLNVRAKARALGIPVIMDTNDRGLIDIERFDLEPERPLLHGLLGDIEGDSIGSLSPQERVDLVQRFLGRGTMSRRLAESLEEIGTTLVSWPQLGSGTTLGAAMVVDVARRMLLQQLECSGRFYADPEQLIHD